MPEPDDHQLLAEFARTESEPAFATLVRRYVNLVYSTAFRSTGNPDHAEEITQAVFVILARKAGKLSPRVLLSGWLYQAARLTAANFVKGEIRRQRREQEAYMQSTLNEPADAAWQEMAPLLDEAMGRLGEADRDAVVLRFFQNKTAAEVAAELKLTEAAAHKRLARALEKLRRFFVKRGVSSTTAIIAGAIAANSVQAAPATMATSVTAIAMAKGAAASASTLTLIKGALKIMAWTKAKMAIVAGVGVLLAAGTTAVAVKEIIAPSPSYVRIHGKGQIELIGNGQPRVVETGEVEIQTDGKAYRLSLVSHGHSNLTNDVYDVTAEYGCDGTDIFEVSDRLSYAHRTHEGVGGFAFSGRFSNIDVELVQAVWLAYCSRDYFNLPGHEAGLEMGSSMTWPAFITNQPTYWPNSTLPQTVTGWSRNWVIAQRRSSLDPLQAIELTQYPVGFKAWKFTASDPVNEGSVTVPRQVTLEKFFPKPPKDATIGEETLLLRRATFTVDKIDVIKGRLDPLPPVPVPDLQVMDSRFTDIAGNFVITSHATPTGWPTRGSKSFKQAAAEATKLRAQHRHMIESENKQATQVIPPK